MPGDETIRPRGRPRVANPRTERLDVRVTPNELEQIQARAGGPRQMSEFVRRAALGRRLPTPVPEPTAEAVSELRRVGNNLNQVARHLNTTHQLGPSEAQQLRALLGEVSVALAEVGSTLARRPLDDDGSVP